MEVKGYLGPGAFNEGLSLFSFLGRFNSTLELTAARKASIASVSPELASKMIQFWTFGGGPGRHWSWSGASSGRWGPPGWGLKLQINHN